MGISCCTGRAHKDSDASHHVMESRVSATMEEGTAPVSTSPLPLFTPAEGHAVVIKNTFITVVENDEHSPERQGSKSTPPTMRLSRGQIVSEHPSMSGRVTVPTEREEFEGAALSSGSGLAAGVHTQEPAAAEETIAFPRPMSLAREASFDDQVHMVVAFACSLLSGWPVVGTESKESMTTWSIVLNVPREHEGYTSQVVSQAKQAMLVAAQNTTSNLVMFRYGRGPFVTLPQGFAVILLGVQPQNDTCWQFLEQGKCTPTCGASHPKFRKNVVFKVLVD